MAASKTMTLVFTDAVTSDRSSRINCEQLSAHVQTNIGDKTVSHFKWKVTQSMLQKQPKSFSGKGNSPDIV